MADILEFQSSQRARQTREDVFPRIIAQEDIDLAILRKQRKALASNTARFLLHGVAWIIILAAIGMTTGV